MLSASTTCCPSQRNDGPATELRQNLKQIDRRSPGGNARTPNHLIRGGSIAGAH